MNSPRLTLPKRSAILLAKLGILSVALSSCASGPKVTVCVVDAKNELYQCADHKDRKFSLPITTELECLSPYDMEAFLKACSKGKLIPVTICRYSNYNFVCQEPSGQQYPISIPSADNYVCVSEQHRKRIEERCGNP